MTELNIVNVGNGQPIRPYKKASRNTISPGYRIWTDENGNIKCEEMHGPSKYYCECGHSWEGPEEGWERIGDEMVSSPCPKCKGCSTITILKLDPKDYPGL